MIEDRALAEWVDTYMTRKFGRLLGAQFFQGQVVSVAGTNFAFTAGIIRSGETAHDGNAYAVNPLYLPAIGDTVECFWRDGHTGYVLWPLNKTGAPTLTNINGSVNTTAVVGNDISGSVSWNVSVNIAAGTRLFTVNFNRGFPVTPQIHVQFTNGSLAALPLNVAAKATGSFDIVAGAATGTGSAYSCDFAVGP